MRRADWILMASRTPAVVYFTMTAVYCLLYFMPFTYVQLLESELVPALVLFAKIHAWLFIPVVVVAGAGTWAVSPCPSDRGPHLAFLIVMGLAGLGLLARPVLPVLGNDLASFLWSQLALVPLVWLAAIDGLAGRGRVRWSRGADAGEARVMLAALGASGAAWAVTTVAAWSRPGVGVGVAGGELGVAALWSLLAHLLLFLGICSVLLLVRGAAAWTSRPSWSEALAAWVLLGAAGTLVVQRGIFGGLAFSGGLADLAAMTLSAALVATWAGLAIQRACDRPDEVDDGFALALAALAPVPPRSPRLTAAWVVGVGLVTWGLLAQLAEVDWNSLMQRLCVVTLWVLVFAAFYVSGRPRPHRPAWLTLSAALPVVVLVALHATVVVGARAVATAGTRTSIPRIVDRYSGYDVSAGLLAGWFPRALDASADVELFTYLQAYTGIPRSVTLTPRDVSFVPDPSVDGGARPNIFVIVVDSLRRDYLGAYNPEVTFTPAIDRLATDSLVFTRAFSRYGATGLSEPSIWVGGLIPHQQYVSPFAPMNALQTLLTAQRYQGFVSLDPILDKIVEPSPWITELDRGKQAGEIQLCGTLAELRDQLDARRADEGPVFLYTQPQDIHIATITRGRSEPIDDESYGGFYAPYASRLRQLDACLGSFVDYLETSGLYDDSVIILTSDHGDSLGEEGRFGHAYTIFPEILRIPLIVHVPPSLRARSAVDLDGLVFSTDLTPSLHTLLGLRPGDAGPVFGRTLFTDEPGARRDYVARDHLVASSYGPVYGLLVDEGRRMYILDAVNYREYLYDLTSDSHGAQHHVTDELRAVYQRGIRTRLEELNRWYGVPTLH